MKIGIVIPHHLPTLDFLNEWKEEFRRNDVYLYIVEDKDKRETSVPEWLNKDIEENTATEEEIAEFERRLRGNKNA